MAKEKKTWRKPASDSEVSLFVNSILRRSPEELPKIIQDALDSRPLLFWSRVSEHKDFPRLVRSIEIKTAMGGEFDKEQLAILKRFKTIERPSRSSAEPSGGTQSYDAKEDDSEIEVTPELTPAELAELESIKSPENSPLFNVQ